METRNIFTLRTRESESERQEGGGTGEKVRVIESRALLKREWSKKSPSNAFFSVLSSSRTTIQILSS